MALASLGFVLSDDAEPGIIDVDGRVLRVVGHVHSPDEFVVGEDSADGHMWVVDVASGRVHHLNQDRVRTGGFLAAFDEYVRDGRSSDTATMLTAEQASQRLAQLRAGRVRPRAATREVVPHNVRFQRLLARLHEIDPEATSSSWWAGIIEQARDELL
ncbi:hypothetical protein GCM10027416_23200 [Okibacterium endophyticum]